MITREANLNDWIELEIFFKRIYRTGHPLHQREFWNWQFGDQAFGRSFICLDDDGTIVGHVGANFAGELSWIINVFLDKEYRGQGVLVQLYSLARNYYPLAATAANKAGLGLYRNMRWFRYFDLVRYVKVNPNVEDKSFKSICKNISVDVEKFRVTDTHYFKQPGIKGIVLSDGSRAVSQESAGGLRIVDIKNLNDLETEAWELGYNWIDYVTSWNDLNIVSLEKNNWSLDYKNVVPWRLNPVEENYFCDITFLSEQPLDKEFIVKRNFSDHGRIGSI
ncbi:MAG: GNAT family N-acetyltransferase [Bacteroidetes bacterium]|nr:GNAT family N-acetyltransferase [Bacteroidota bacterium]